MSTTIFAEPLLEREISLPEPASGLTQPGFPLSTVSPERALPVRQKARTGRHVARRRVRLDWEATAVILLMLVCTAVCVYRLFWAVQP